MDNWQSFNDWQKYKTVLDTFKHLDLSITDFIVNLIKYDQEFTSEYGSLVRDVFDNADSMFLAFAQHRRSASTCLKWATSLSTEIYKGEIKRLTNKSAGFHFNASNATAHQISDFASGELVSRMSVIAPNIWGLMQSLLLSEGGANARGDDEWRLRIFNLVSLYYISDIYLLTIYHLTEDIHAHRKSSDSE